MTMLRPDQSLVPEAALFGKIRTASAGRHAARPVHPVPPHRVAGPRPLGLGAAG
jgi:hypothetical protein